MDEVPPRNGDHPLFPKEDDPLYALAQLLQRVLNQYLGQNASRESNSARILTPLPPVVRHTSNEVKEITEQLLQAKKDDALSVRYIQTLRSHLLRFAAVFDRDIASIRTPDIEKWLRSQAVGPRARNNMRGSVLTLFHFARKQGCLPKGIPTEADDVALAKEVGGKIGILKPDELTRIIHPAPETLQLYFALGAFTGMRSSEILRLEWKDFNFERAFITVAPEKAKTATRRLVPIHPNLNLWLNPYRGADG